MARSRPRQRRFRGTGGVFERRDGRWEGRWQAPPDGSGTRPWVRVYAPSAPECDHALDEAIQDFKRRRNGSEGSEKVADYLDRWLTDHVSRLKPKTQHSYEVNVRRYLNPCVGMFALGDLRRSHVQAMVNTVADSAGTRSAIAAHATLRSALNDLDEGVIEKNPCERVHLPTYRRHVPEPWQLDEARAFLAGIKGHRDEALYLISALYGTRPYEVLGLTTDHLDLERGELRIDYGIQWPDGKDPFLSSVKSAAGHRTLRLTPRVLDALRAYLALKEKQRDAAADEWLDSPLVFTEPKGRARRIDTMNKRFHRLCADLGLRRVRLYDLRRLAAALIVQQVGKEAAQKTLGQSSIRVTMEMYDYQLKETAATVAEAVDSLFEPKPARLSGTSVTSARSKPTGPPRSGADRGALRLAG